MSASGWEPVTDPAEIKRYKATKTNDWEPVTDPNAIRQYHAQKIKNNLPFPIGQALQLAASINQPIGERAQESLAGIGQGLTNIGQGVKQYGLEKFGQPGAAQQYTQQAQNERNAFARSPAGRDYLSQLLSRGVSSTPEMAALGPLGFEGLAAKMLGTGAAMGTVKGLEFTPSGESRRMNMIKGAAEGAAFPLIEPVVGGGISSIQGASRALKDIPNIFREPFRNISPLEQKATQTAQEAKQAQDAYKEATENYGTPAKNEREAYKIQERLKDLQNQLAQPHPISVNPTETQNNVIKAQVAHKEAQDIANQVDQQIAAHLNEGAQHDVRVASKVFDKADAERRALGQGYKALESELEQKQIPIDNTNAIQEKTSELHDLIKSGMARSPEMDSVLKELDTLKEQKPVTAKEYLHTLQSVKDYARKAREKSYSYGMNKEERLQYESKFNELDDKAEEMAKTLEENIAPEQADRLRELNAGWRERVIPLQRNRIYQRLKNEGKMSADIIKDLRGEKNPGNQIIKEIIQNDPEALRNVVGQRYANKPEKLHNLDETAQEYVNKMPELQDMIKQREVAQSAIPATKQKLEEAAQLHKETESTHAANLKAGEKRTAIQDEISDIQENKLPALDRTIQDLRSKKAQKNISLKEKVKHEDAFNKAKERKEKYTKRLKILLGIAGTGIVGYKAIRTGTALLNRTPYEENTGEK